MDLDVLLARVPEGWSVVSYLGRPFGLTRTDRVDGRSVTIYAEELGGSDAISANIYRGSNGDMLRSCEMPDAKVLDFLRTWTPIPAPSQTPGVTDGTQSRG